MIKLIEYLRSPETYEDINLLIEVVPERLVWRAISRVSIDQKVDQHSDFASQAADALAAACLWTNVYLDEFARAGRPLVRASDGQPWRPSLILLAPRGRWFLHGPAHDLIGSDD